MTSTFWKRCVAWVTGLRSNIFVWARLKLTLLYLLVMILILGVFSFLFYYSILEAIERNVARTFMDPLFQTIIIQNMSQQTRTLILVGDAVIFLTAAFSSYFLAGRTLRPIQDTMQLQQQFTADASHELRTPLTILKTDLEVALRQIDFQPHLTRSLLESNLEEVNRLVRLAEQLLSSLKDENSMNRQTVKPVVLSDIVRHMVQKLRTLAQEKRVNLSLEQARGGYVLGIQEQLEAVILNVVQNALDHTPPGGQVQVSVISEPHSLKLIIQDSGNGIPPADLPFIFERFYKADKTRESGRGGAGLGLAIVREIVQRHQGSIHVDSVVGQGTTIHMEFPRQT